MNNQEVRLQKYLARCGIASRRHCEQYIQDGRVSINDKLVTKLGTKVDPQNDIVKFDGLAIKPKLQDITIMLNKPAGYVSTMSDPQNRPCVANLVPVDECPSLFPIGRLDRLTCGLLLFSTDGELGQRLLHPKHEVDKCYEVIIDGRLDQNSSRYRKLCEGIEIQSGKTRPAKIDILEYMDFQKYLDFENEFFENCASSTDQACLPNEDKLINKTFTRLNIVIHEGKNRQIRRMFSSVGLEVLLLVRKNIGNLKLDKLEKGKWRKLSQEEIESIFA